MLYIIRSSEKFLSFYKELMHNIFSSTLFYRITYDSFCFINGKDRNVRQIRFHVCIKMRRCKRRVKERHFSDNLIRTVSFLSPVNDPPRLCHQISYNSIDMFY